MTEGEQATDQGRSLSSSPSRSRSASSDLHRYWTASHRPLIPAVFRGNTTNWAAPAIVALNPGKEIPNKQITVIHRSDGSWTTYIFSDYLSHVSGAWPSTFGVGRSINWRVGYGGDGNADAASLVARTPGLSATASGRTPSHAVRRRALGHSDSDQHRRRCHKPEVSASAFSIVDEPGPRSYPIVGYTWVLVLPAPNEYSVGHCVGPTP